MWLSVAAVCSLVLLVQGQTTEDDRVRDFLESSGGYNDRAEAIYNTGSIANWAYYTNITDYNRQQMVGYM